MQPTEREPNNFCQVPGQKCYMNYCDENGCQDRKRRYTALGMSRLNNADLLAQLLKNQEDKEQVELVVAEINERLATARPTAPAATAEAWVSVLERLPEEGQQVLLAGPFSEDMVFGRLNPNKGLRGWQIGWPYHALWSMEQYPYWHPAPAFPTPSQKGTPTA